MNSYLRSLGIAAAALLVGLTWPAGSAGAGGPDAPEEPSAHARAARKGELVEGCMGCHEDMADDERLEFADGSSLPLLVTPEDWEGSVHAGKLSCNDCHTMVVENAHSRTAAGSAREYRLEATVTCRRCHYAYYTRQLDSVHFAELAAGNPEAPTCVDCHGAHSVEPAHWPRVAVEQRCARCHEEASTAYVQSVHGAAMTGDTPADVPVCTDCHGVHRMEDPRTDDFHARSYALCARCHSDQERMARYGLSAEVVTTYLDDFHGVSNRLYADGAGTPGRPMATCVDCHGVHDIQPMDHSGSADDVRARVATVCRKCHEEAPDEFADAWLSHYPATFDRAPLVWAVTWVYRILIPLIMVGLVLHILLDLWRMRVHSREEAMQ